MAKIFDISDFSAPELDVYARLTENQLVNRADPANALFIAESPLVIGRALDAGCVPVSFLMERRHVDGKAREILARCPADIPVYAAELDVLTQLTGFHLTRGMPGTAGGRRPVRQRCARGRAGKRDEPDEHRRDLPLGGGARRGRRAAHVGGQRPALPPRRAREHGHGLSGAVDVPA